MYCSHIKVLVSPFVFVNLLVTSKSILFGRLSLGCCHTVQWQTSELLSSIICCSINAYLEESHLQFRQTIKQVLR